MTLKNISFIDKSKFIKCKLCDCFKIVEITDEAYYMTIHCFDKIKYDLVFDTNEKYVLKRDCKKLLILRKIKDFDDSINLPLITYQLNLLPNVITELETDFNKIENDFNKIDIQLYC